MNPNDHRPEGSAEPMKTFCHSFDEAYPAKIVDFHGWALPIQYDGILAEHAWTRSKCGMFNVSHMGRFRISGPHSADFLDELITGSVRKVANGQALYTLLCDPSGGILDDIIIYKHRSDDYFVVVNAAMRDADWAWMQEHIADRSVAMIDQSGALAQIALQGPLAEAVHGCREPSEEIVFEPLLCPSRHLYSCHGTALGMILILSDQGDRTIGRGMQGDGLAEHAAEVIIDPIGVITGR